MPTDHPTPRTYRLSPTTLDGLRRLASVIRPGVVLKDVQVIEAVVLDRLKAEDRRAARAASPPS